MKDIPPLNAAMLLKRHGLRADKRLGQNFLQDPLALEKIAAAAEIQKMDSVLEIGAGLGGLTRYLAVLARDVTTIELDPNLASILEDVIKPYDNIRLIRGDILELTPKELGLPQNYVVAANIPYNITSAIIRHLLESEPKPRRIVLTVQKEVAQRICATPPDMSLLALSVQVYGKPGISARIPAGAFFPAPKVDSAVVKIDIYPEPLVRPASLPTFFKLIKAGFSQKRKTLRNSLSAGLRISKGASEALLANSGIDPQRRAETLSIQEWEILSGNFMR
ncbi:MAG TPA: 16S rRNA (adenine(1518)-N(6)/adenine(1519)-N(6))-dimethyltransferase RsmA [Anaerolineales bacterium]|jgi:16S rRNA (adenine1518-N6/adenine1519-N6)-dimethyltransferase|nr:16S rRNA (adenine(1518)-N(6)/adenine(1519)-N(6))-dimethyltransferase RsmA [Anaerolineales bacterium]